MEDGKLSQALKEKVEQCENVTIENVVLKHEMESTMMRMKKEIEEKKKNEENLAQSLKEKYEECIQLDNELEQSKNNEEVFEKHIDDLRNELAIANEYKEKFKDSLAKLDELIKG